MTNNIECLFSSLSSTFFDLSFSILSHDYSFQYFSYIKFVCFSILFKTKNNKNKAKNNK